MEKVITASVELYNGPHKERVEINISEDDLKKFAERKAREFNYCDSCQTVDIKITISV